MSRAAISLLPLLLIASTLRAEEAPPAKSVRKPPVLKPRHDGDGYSFRLRIRPGVVDPGKTLFIELDVSEILSDDDLDSEFGSRRPVEGAEVTGYLVALPSGKKRSKKKLWTAARWGVPLPDAGNYGFTFTPPKKGAYAFYAKGKTDKGKRFAWSVHVPVGVWPLPDGQTQNDAPPALASKLPAPAAGDMSHGKALCAKRCRTDLEAALPPGKPPVFLHSSFASSHNNAKLLAAVMSDGAQLTKLEVNDLLFYLHTLHLSVEDFFPGAAIYLSHEFTINEHGRKRLGDSIKLELDDEAATATVFVVYKGKRQDTGAKLVDFNDRVARNDLNRGDKIGYLIFLDLPKEPKAKELAVALEKEPSYKIVGLRARDAKGHEDAALNKQLRSFIGKGRFNDPRSLRKGSKSLQKKLLPIYLKAAELATMYYADEREFNAFDAEFGDGEEDSVAGGEMQFKKNVKRKH